MGSQQQRTFRLWDRRDVPRIYEREPATPAALHVRRLFDAPPAPLEIMHALAASTQISSPLRSFPRTRLVKKASPRPFLECVADADDTLTKGVNSRDDSFTRRPAANQVEGTVGPYCWAGSTMTNGARHFLFDKRSAGDSLRCAARALSSARWAP